MILALTCSSFQHCCTLRPMHRHHHHSCVRWWQKLDQPWKTARAETHKAIVALSYLSINCCSVSAMSPSSSWPSPSSSLVGACSFCRFLCDGSNDIEMSLQKEMHHNAPRSYLRLLLTAFSASSPNCGVVPLEGSMKYEWRQRRYLSHRGDHMKKVFFLNVCHPRWFL